MRWSSSGRGRRRGLVLVVAALAVMGLLAVFAIELSDTQARSRRDVEARVHERAVLAAALIDSLLSSVQQQRTQDEVTFGARVVPGAVLDAARQQNLYLALLDARGTVLASSRGFTAQAHADLARSAALAIVRRGRPFGLGNVLPYGKSGVVNLAVAFPTRYGPRILVTGFSPLMLGQLLSGELKRIPGVKGAHNYLLDANDTVIASNNPGRGSGDRFTTPAQVQALSRVSGDRNGHYYDEVGIENSTWRVVLTAPDGPLFASVSGFRGLVPWIIFVAFALVAAIALTLGGLVVRSAEGGLREANARLNAVNGELEATNAQLEKQAHELASSNAELEQFASIASHDLQEPLRKIRTFTEQLTATEAPRLSDKGRDYLQRANRAAERMQTLVQDLLRFSRVTTQARAFTTVQLDDIVSETLEDLSLEIERAGAIVHREALPEISADALQMRQLMQNLISNALKFRRPDVTPELSIRATVADDCVRLVVADNGIGFDAAYAQRIFRVFERLHGRSEYPGTGIGLALCLKIVERHGGSIVAEGAIGSGATFIVTLPLSQPGTDLQAPQAALVAARDREAARAGT